MSDMATGIPIGVAIGLAAGMAAGQQDARRKLAAYIGEKGLKIQDTQNRPVSLEEVLDEALKTCCAPRQRLLLWIALGLGVLALIGASVFYFSAR